MLAGSHPDQGLVLQECVKKRKEKATKIHYLDFFE